MALTACKRTVSGSISLPCSCTFHLSSRYLFAIGLSVVFSLTRRFWQIQTGFHMSCPTQVHQKIIILRIRVITLYDATFQRLHFYLITLTSWSYNPTLPKHDGLGCSRSLATTRESLIVSFPQLLRCFSSLVGLKG